MNSRFNFFTILLLGLTISIFSHARNYNCEVFKNNHLEASVKLKGERGVVADYRIDGYPIHVHFKHLKPEGEGIALEIYSSQGDASSLKASTFNLSHDDITPVSLFYAVEDIQLKINCIGFAR